MSASGVSPKWVKSRRRRKKVSENNEAAWTKITYCIVANVSCAVLIDIAPEKMCSYQFCKSKCLLNRKKSFYLFDSLNSKLKFWILHNIWMAPIFYLYFRTFGLQFLGTKICKTYCWPNIPINSCILVIMVIYNK